MRLFWWFLRKNHLPKALKDHFEDYRADLLYAVARAIKGYDVSKGCTFSTYLVTALKRQKARFLWALRKRKKKFVFPLDHMDTPFWKAVKEYALGIDEPYEGECVEMVELLHERISKMRPQLAEVFRMKLEGKEWTEITAKVGTTRQNLCPMVKREMITIKKIYYQRQGWEL